MVCCSFAIFVAEAQNNSHTPLEDVVNAIKNNRVSEMARYFDNVVPITLNNNLALYSQNQAIVVLRDFFEKNNPKDLVVMDNGSPNATSKFMIGSFVAPNGIKYSVYVLLKMKDHDYVLQELRFNKEQ